MEQILSHPANFGLPITVCAHRLVRSEGQREQLTVSINKLENYRKSNRTLRIKILRRGRQ